ncbi:MAG: glycosyltransferase family 2 protein [Magnetococcales bacterium]|nr:glycosyltransferase family 2 protein [Magnetococcales bacterium]
MRPNRLTIVIPALNEEEAIAETVRGALAAEPVICEQGGLDGVSVLVVDDGSTDRTGEIASSIEGVTCITHPKNLGYGAALKTGFRHAGTEYLSFMDADGTLNPASFGTLVETMKRDRLDVVLGSRVHANSQMPLVRRIGNRFFALLLSLLSGTRVRDSASGMRVLTYRCLEWIDLLPDGLHFTPAMSAMALFDHTLRIGETPVSYKVRVGRSKLNLIQDGLRFLGIILSTAYTYLPALFFILAGVMMVLTALGLGFPMLEHYARYQEVPEYLFNRVILVSTIGIGGVMSFLMGGLANNAAQLVHRADFTRHGRISRFMNRWVLRYTWFFGLLALTLAGAILLPGLADDGGRLMEGLHWSRKLSLMLLVIVGAFLLMVSSMYTFQLMAKRRLIRLGHMREPAEGPEDSAQSASSTTAPSISPS